MAINITDLPSNNTQPVLLSHHFALFYMTCFLHIFVCTFGFLSNGLFCIVIVYYPRLQTPFNALAWALSIGDFLGSVISIPIAQVLVQYHHRTLSLETPLCQLNVFFLNLCKWSATLIMTEMAVIRAKCVFAKRVWQIPFSKIKLILLFNTVATSVFSIYRAYFSKTIICFQHDINRMEHMLINIGVFLGLFLLLIIGYIILSVTTRKRGAAIARRDRNTNRFEIATLQAGALIVTSYLVCHLPYISYTVMLSLRLTYDDSYYTHSFFVSIFSLCFVVDSLILSVTSSEYRKHACLLLKRMKLKPYSIPH